MKKKTTEEFIEQARKVHGDKYDYSKVEYKGSQIKVCIVLPNVGEFWQTPQNHLKGCYPEMINCGRRKIKRSKPVTRSKKYSLETFIEKANNKHQNKYDYSNVNYTDSKEKVCIICPEHGMFWQAPSKHLQGIGCPICGHIKKWNTRKRKLSVLKIRHKKHIIKSSKHKNEYLIFKKLNWIKKFKLLHGNKYKYLLCNCSKQHDHMQVFCKKHNYWYNQSILHHLHGSGCPICAGGNNKPYTTEEFVIKAKEIHGNLYNYKKVKYINKDTPVEIICEKHGSFWQKPHNHINSGGCQTCKATKTQLKVFNLLKQNFPEEEWLWEYQPVWLGLQRFDIYNKRCNLAIEYNGEQHYFPVDIFGGEKAFEFTVQRDKLKIEKCKNNNCTLYIIKYDEFNDKKIIDDISRLLNQN